MAKQSLMPRMVIYIAGIFHHGDWVNFYELKNKLGKEEKGSYIHNMKQGENKEGTMSLKISKSVHKKLKLWCVENNCNLTEFADTALLSSLATKNKYKPKSIKNGLKENQP